MEGSSVEINSAGTSLLENLQTSSVLITQDWAMKFLPQKYRETQADWFAKRGISWHISVVARKIADDKLQHQAFVHIVENCSQDSNLVVSIIRHTLQELKKEHLEITTAFLRQDNAGCYHSFTMLAACQNMKEATDIKVERVNSATHKAVGVHATEEQQRSKPMLFATLTKDMM